MSKAKMRARGRLIVFEGPDGVGKSTVAKALTHRLRLDGVACEYLSFPGQDRGSLGRHIYDLHHRPAKFGVSTIGPAALQLLHVAAHVDLLERAILPMLNEGRCIVLDRYWWSTWVYGRVSGLSDQFLEQLIRVEQTCWRGIQPEAVILLLRSQRGHASRARGYSKLAQAYGELAAARKSIHPVHVVANDRSLADTLNEVYGHLVGSTEAGLGLGHRTNRGGSRGSTRSCTTRAMLDASWNLGEQRSGTPFPYFFRALDSPVPSEAYNTYWRFAHERQEIFFRKIARQRPPWSADPILQRYKFTNAYRAADRVTQFLISRIIYEGDQSPEEVFFRIILFKLFNRVETWQALEAAVGQVTWTNYSFVQYDAILTGLAINGGRIYSGAYIMPPAGTGLVRKHRGHLKLLESMMADRVPLCVAEAVSFRQVFDILRSYQGIGNFLAFQFATDLNYSAMLGFSEMEFVVPGPGAADGIHKCFEALGSLNESDVIKFVTERQAHEFAILGLAFRSLWGRPLQLIDCQNLFCEVSKYARVAHPHLTGKSNRKRIKQVYTPNPAQIRYWFPPKWGLNELARSGEIH